jgi:hypothetical protein
MISRKYSFSTDKDSEIITSPMDRSAEKGYQKHVEQSWDHTHDSRIAFNDRLKSIDKGPLFTNSLSSK